MSYEGFYEYLCKNGHYHSWDVYDPDKPDQYKPYECPDCGAGVDKFYSVDHTNGCEGDGLRGRLKLVHQDACPECGQGTAPAIFALEK